MKGGLDAAAEPAAREEGWGGGGDALAGYEYQIDVSIWLGLDLLLASRLTQEIVLEPASQEDIEAELQETEPGRVTTRVAIDSYTLVVQAKLRDGDAWTVAGIKALLKHGGPNRRSAAERLAATDVRYLLVTSATLNGGARGLKVRRAGVWPKAADMPATIAGALPLGAAGRVAVIGGLDEERLAGEIKRLLTERFRVPNASWVECFKVLREEARVRIRSGGSGRWRREALERVIRKHDGYLAATPELEHYVHPTNWRDLRGAMRTRHAALIVGQSGTGKTLASRKLYEELRAEVPGLAHVPIRLGPHQLRDDRTRSPVLYDIEDPWGRFDFDPNSRPWNDQLAGLFAHATHDRMIVATTRRDVAQAAGALDAVAPWLVPLEAEHYGTSERARLYRTRIDQLPRDLQLIAAQSEAQVLGELATPLELQKFFDALRALDREGLKNPPGFVADAIRRAHQDSIEQTVVEQVEQRRDVRAAAVVWALLKVADKVSLRVVRNIEEGLADREPAMSEGVSPLVDFFVAARNLRAGDGVVTYYHPRVEAGIERTLVRHALPVRRTLRTLIELLVSPVGPGETWGAGAAARIIAALDGLPDLAVEPSSSAASKIDAWLSARLADGGSAFGDHLKLAAAAGSPGCTGAELARYLLHRSDRSFGRFHIWAPPDRDEEWYERLRADPATKPLLETFISDVLPTERDDYATTLVAETERLASELTPAYLAAAERAVHFGFIHSDDVIAQGALRDLDGFERIVDAAVDVLTPTEEERRKAEETHLAIVNGVYSDDYAEHMADNDEGHTAGVFLRAYVEHVRTTKGWRVLAQHRHRDSLLGYWFRDLAHEATNRRVDSDELAGAFAAGHGGQDEDALWFVLLRSWDERYRPALRARVHDGHHNTRVRRAALSCLVERIPDELSALASELVSGGGAARLLMIAIDLADLRDRRAGDGERRGDAASQALGMLSPVYAELSEAALQSAPEHGPMLSADARAALVAAGAAGEDVRRFRIRMAGRNDLAVDEDIRWLLAHAEDDNAAVEAIEAAIRRGMTPDVERALDHRFAQVSARALTAIGQDIEAPLPEQLLAKAGEAGSPVRKALVALLAEKPHPGHLPTLLHLAKDTWSSSSRYYGEDDDFPIAQAAVRSMEALAPLAPDQVEQLYGIAIDTSDPSLRTLIFVLLARTTGAPLPERLFDLAIAPGRAPVRLAAAKALLDAGETVGPALVARITPDLLRSRAAPVAAMLALLLAVSAEPPAVVEVARALATHPKRRVLLVLLIWVLADHDRSAADAVAEFMPAGHPAIARAFGGDPEVLEDAALADLGDPVTCAQVLRWMNPVARPGARAN
jgi:hypothetical protein